MPGVPQPPAWDAGPSLPGSPGLSRAPRPQLWCPAGTPPGESFVPHMAPLTSPSCLTGGETEVPRWETSPGRPARASNTLPGVSGESPAPCGSRAGHLLIVGLWVVEDQNRGDLGSRPCTPHPSAVGEVEAADGVGARLRSPGEGMAALRQASALQQLFASHRTAPCRKPTRETRPLPFLPPSPAFPTAHWAALGVVLCPGPFCSLSIP